MNSPPPQLLPASLLTQHSWLDFLKEFPSPIFQCPHYYRRHSSQYLVEWKEFEITFSFSFQVTNWALGKGDVCCLGIRLHLWKCNHELIK